MKYEIVQCAGGNNPFYMVIESAKGAVSPAGYIVRDYRIVVSHVTYATATAMQKQLTDKQDADLAHSKLL